MGLVLSRKSGEEIKIGETIVLKIVKIRGDRAKVMIEAPESVSILRGELRTSSESQKFEEERERVL